MRLYNLGKVPWKDSQIIYHAMAEIGQEALILISPATPYVCIGFHQDAAQEVDLEYCRKNGIPVFRREVGGGAVYLDGNQLFFQMILRRDNPAVPRGKDAFYRKFLQPIVNTYRIIGIDADYKPVNDVIVKNRKISGTGVAEIGESIVFVGNLIVDFNYKKMSRILKIPDEKFRDKVYKTMEENLTTIRRELGLEESDQWSETKLNKILADQFQNLTGPMQTGEKGNALLAKMDEIGTRMLDENHLLNTGRRCRRGKEIRIRSGVTTIQRMHKANGGLIRADFVIMDNRLYDIKISGDFFCYPGDSVLKIESALEGISRKNVRQALKTVISENDVDFPGISFNDWMHILN